MIGFLLLAAGGLYGVSEYSKRARLALSSEPTAVDAPLTSASIPAALAALPAVVDPPALSFVSIGGKVLPAPSANESKLNPPLRLTASQPVTRDDAKNSAAPFNYFAAIYPDGSVSNPDEVREQFRKSYIQSYINRGFSPEEALDLAEKELQGMPGYSQSPDGMDLL